MKLRHKLTFGVTFLAAFVIMISGILIISQYRRVMLEESIKSVQEETTRLSAKLEESIRNAGGLDYIGASSKETVLRYFVASEEIDAENASLYALYHIDKPIYNNTGIDLTQERKKLSSSADYSYPYCFLSGGEKSYCMTEISVLESKPSATNTNEYCVYVVRDVTEVADKISHFILFCFIIGLCTVALCAIGIVLFLKKELRPLEKLTQATKEIADGKYEIRISQKEKKQSKQDELDTLTESFNKMTGAVECHVRDVEESADKQKMMLASLAHEMRTPVTAISGYAYALGNTKLNDVQKNEAVRFIDEESRRLSRLSEKLRLLVGLEHSAPVFSEIETSEWQVELSKLLSSVCKINCEMDFAETAVIFGDRDLLTVLITNLCTNAQRAGADSIRISYCGGVLSVSDNGPGIKPELLPKITEPFFVGNASRSRKDQSQNDGFGLGLTICSRIAELHKSKLIFGSSESGGLTVSVDLNPVFTTSLHFHDDSQTESAV